MNEKPNLQGLNQLEAGVLIHKYICILAMINYGTPTEKATAKKHLAELEKKLPLHLNDAAVQAAIKKMDWDQEEVKLINAV
ncbi:hypothetical protein [Paenibacillus sp. Y412MC10]|uniref:hypothetical protein n=1 Tax=Geobacillus sp. (strain Y412MC10) TaxID=481743 RepID=UPI0021B32F80|nr:hypothetical protein [Paenibacillus sp. Y412MC10]